MNKPAPFAGVSELCNPRMRKRLFTPYAFLTLGYIVITLDNTECMLHFSSADRANTAILPLSPAWMRARMIADCTHPVFVFMTSPITADRTSFTCRLRTFRTQHMREFQIADLARVAVVTLRNIFRMAALSRRAADSALTRIARIILMPLMLLVTLLAKSRMISGPAMLMRPGEQSQFIRFHCAPPQNGVLLPDGTRQMTELFSGFGLLLASTSSRLKFS